MEHITNGNLTQFFAKLRLNDERYVSRWNDTFKAKLTFCIASTMMHVHSFNANHWRLSPDIICFDENFNPKITDFSMSKISLRNKYLTEYKRKMSFYDPPEVRSSDIITSKSDVYSFGVVLLSIVQGNERFKFREGEDGLLIPEDTPKLIYGIIWHCLNPDYKKRPNFAQIVKALMECPKLFPETKEEEYNSFVSMCMKDVEISHQDSRLFIKSNKDNQKEKEEKLDKEDKKEKEDKTDKKMKNR